MIRVNILFILFIITFTGCTATNNTNQTKTIKETIPITMANLRGHESLYNEGWFIISSSKEVLKFAKKQGVDNAKRALLRASKSISSNTSIYSDNVVDYVDDGYDTTKYIYDKGTQNSKDILNKTEQLSKAQLDYSRETFLQAWGSLIKGNITLSTRTKQEREELANMSGNYFKDLNSDFSNLGEIASSITLFANEEISSHWENAFVDAKNSFTESYDNSGESDSSLGGLFHIMHGYLKVIYHGVLKPTAKTAKSGVENTYQTGESIAKLMYLPVGASISVVGRSVQSLGLTLYYTSSIGVKIVSPTVEAGFLSALSVLSLNSSALTYVSGETLGVINQIGTVAIAPVAGASETVVKTAYDTTKLVTFVSYDVLNASTKIFINEAASGIVLGYNALLAIPTHTLMAASDSVFFLAWDGPRLVVAMAKGEIANENINKLPVGTVVDLKKLNKEKGITVKVVSKDYTVIQNILMKIPNDVRK